MVIADRIKLKQVILNLVSNAIKYNKEKGSVEIKLTVAFENKLRLSVTDTGTGIPEDRQEGLFQAFNRLGIDESIEGTGIGLVITKKLIEQMNGIIDFTSTFGKGSCFSIVLPLYDEQITDIKESSEVQQTPFLKTLSSRKFVILYVEDNPVNIELMKQVFMIKNNIELLTAMDANLGIEIANTQQPDLILMDINLPGINGVEATKILKNNPKTSKIPVIAVSANAMESDIEQAKAAGFADYVPKPINLPQLIEKIDKVLNENK